MAVLTVTELQRYVERVQQRLLTLERRFAPPPATRGTSGARNFSYFKVTKPILPGRQGLGVQVSYNTLITSDPIDPDDPEQFWLSDEYEGWTEISSAEYEIHDSAHKTLAMVGDIIVAEYRYNKWRTFTEFGLANVRTKVLEDVDYETGPAVQAKYQILIGDDEVPQVYEGQPVYVTRMVTHSLSAGEEFLLSYDRTAKEWFIAEPWCPDLPKPGGHASIVAATIAPGAVGPINFNGRIYDVKNHSNCEARLGNNATFVVSPDCESFFTLCKCCGEDPETDCCDLPIVICVNGRVDIASIKDTYSCYCLTYGGLGAYCCDSLQPRDIAISEACEELAPAKLEFSIDCTPTGSLIVTWTLTGSEGVIASGTWEIPGVCDDPPTIERRTISITGGCDIEVAFAAEYSEELCETPVPSCCDKLLWLCLNNDSAELSVNGGSHIFDVTACCEGCTSAELRVTITCNPESENPLSLNWQYWCDGVQVDAGAINISAFCTSDDPVIYNLNPGCFLQLQVSINNAGCDGCGPTVYVPPPPA